MKDIKAILEAEKRLINKRNKISSFKSMNLTDAVNILEKHQKWRKGAEIEQIQPYVLSEAIDIIIKHIRQ
jgi:deoxyhypusine synthase